MNLRQKGKLDFCALAGLKKRRQSSKLIERDPKLDKSVCVSLIRDDLNFERHALKINDKHEVSVVPMPQYIAEEKNNLRLGASDPKLRMPCKVHLVRISQPLCSTNEAISCKSDSKFNMLCKVIVNQNELAAIHGSKAQRNVGLKQNGLLKPANHFPETTLGLPGTISSGIKATSHSDQPCVTSESVTETNECRVEKISNGQDKRINFDTVCHAVCDHAIPDKTNGGFKCDSNKEAEPRQKTDTTTETKRRKIIALKDHNEIVPRKRVAKKKIAPSVASENVPEVVVEKCTDRIPVYKKLDEKIRNSLNRKSNPYEFTELDPDPDNIKKPKRRRKLGVRNKKTKHINMTYNKCIKQIMNKLAITVQSNKFVTREIEKSPKNKAVLPTKIVRIQTKRPKVKFKDVVLEQPVTNKEINQVHNVNKTQVNNINTDNIMPLNTANLSEANLSSKNIAKLDDNNRIIINPQPDVVKHGKEDTKQINQNRNILRRGIHRKYENKKNMNPRRLFCESDQPPSPKVNSHNSDNSNDMFDVYSDVCNPPRSPSPIHQDQQSHASSTDQHMKINEPLDDDDPDMSFASQISITRCASTCSTVVEESHHVSPKLIADDDPYFGFDADDDNIIQPSPEIVRNRYEVPHQKKWLPPLEMTRKTDSPWRYSPRNISFNPHFVRLKPNALPVINQDPVLDSTFDENIKKHHPELNTVERTEQPRKKSPVQKSILNYVTSDVHTNKENTKQLSMFDDEELSPIKISNKTAARLEPSKAKRNILGALNSNILVHSVVIVSTPHKDKPSDHIESPNLSVILEELKDNHKTFKRGTTRLQDLNSEARIASNIEDFHGFSVDHVEMSTRISNKIGNILKEHEKTSTDQQIQEQTFFGFDSLTEDENVNNKGKEKVPDKLNKNGDAKPFRLSLNGKRIQRKKVHFQSDEVQVNVNSKAQSDSEDDFIPPTPVPENESLKVGLFEEIESKKSSKTYRSRKRYREFMVHDSEDEEDAEQHRKKKKDQPTKAEVEEFNKWAAQFNAMCDEVEQFPLEID